MINPSDFTFTAFSNLSKRAVGKGVKALKPAIAAPNPSPFKM